MRTRTRRTLAAALLTGAAVGVGHGVRQHPPTTPIAHDCDRVELFFPTSTLIFGTSDCTLHNGSHVCLGDVKPEIALVVCRD